MNAFEEIAQELEKGSPYILYRQDLAWILRKVAAAHSDDDRTKNDAARYRWLRRYYDSVNFEPGDHDGMDVIFAVPQGVVTADCDKTIDALMNGANA